MKAVVQRVKYATLKVDGKLISRIGEGFLVFLGVKKGDTNEKADYLAKKISALRVFEDENGKMNKSLSDIGGEILAVSQFTLLADVSHGNRPGFTDAELPEKAQPIYEYFIERLKYYDISVKCGIFGADMKIELLNDGPTTILYEV